MHTALTNSRSFCRCFCLLATIFVIATGDCLAEINLVQDTTETAEGTDTVAAVFSLPPTEGNLLIAVASNRDGSAAPSTPTGWTVLMSSPAGSPGQIWYYKVAGASESDTVSVGPYPITSRRGLQLFEYSGVDTTDIVVDTASAAGTGHNISSGSVTAGDECFVLMVLTQNANSRVSTWTDSFDELHDFVNAGAPGSKSTYAAADTVSLVGGTFSTTATSDSTGDWISQIVSFSAAQNCACTVTTVADSGPGSLRECLTIANNCTGTTIDFDIPGPGNMSDGADSWWRIQPDSALPLVYSRTTVLDATTQTVNQGNTNSRGPEIEINGDSAGNCTGLLIAKPDNIIKGLVINGFDASARSGIYLGGSNTTGNTIQGCYIGTSATGDSAIGNNYGLRLSSGPSNNQFGGSGAGEGNLISGNISYGVYHYLNCDNNSYYGNFIGTNASCDTALPNGSDGVMFSGGSGNIIGGENSGEGNVVSGNVAYGLRLANANNTLLQGNKIGTDSSGTVGIPNGLDGVYFLACDTATIGGAAAGEGNIISANLGSGIMGAPLDNATIYGNMIGTGPTGTETGLGNQGDDGIRLYNFITINDIKIGGLGAGEGNVIAEGAHSAVYVGVPGQNIEVAGNIIRDHAAHGIESFSDSLRIIGNLIYGNGIDGIRFVGTDTANFIFHNTVHGNGGDGIRIGATGAVIKNNIMTGNSGYGLRMDSGSVIESNNLITDTILDPSNLLGRSTETLDISDVNGDPKYADTLSADYSLTECTSPAINTGVDLGADQPDMNGAVAGLYNGAAPDIGAFESLCTSILSVSINNSDFSFGVAQLNQWLTPDSSLVVNDGTVAENFAGQISQFSDGSNTWDIDASTNGADSIRAQYSTVSNTGPWMDISDYGADFTFANNVAVGDTVTVWFRIQSPVSTTSYSEYSSSFVVTAEPF